MTDADKIDVHLVYAGIRVDGTFKKYCCFIELDEKGEKCNFDYIRFKYNRKLDKNIGNIYLAQKNISDDGSFYGLHNARFISRYNDDNEIISWEAYDRENKQRHEEEKLRKNVARISEIDRIMQPLRESYKLLYDNFNQEGCKALEQAVLKSLKRKPKKCEVNNEN